MQKAYASLRVLEDVDFTLPQGQALGVLGPNGAGKSTLLSVIAGVEKTTGGSVVYRGEDVTARRADDRCRMGIGRTYQIPRPFGGLTVFENALVGAQRGAGLRGSAARTAALEAVDAAGLSAVANATAGSLPLLQRKRLELARALATGPQLLLLDEIAGGLTDAEAGELVASITALKDRGTTLVWIEHVVKALVQVVDRLICLAGGVLVADGAPDDVLASRAVAEVYLGTPA